MKKMILLITLLPIPSLCMAGIFKYIKPAGKLLCMTFCTPSSGLIEPRLNAVQQDISHAQRLIEKKAYNFNHLIDLLTIRYLLIMALHNSNNAERCYNLITQITHKMEILKQDIITTGSSNLFIQHETETLGGLITRITGNMQTLQVTYRIYNPKKEY